METPQTQSKPTLDGSQASAILSADLSNLVSKVKSGKPLTAAQRQLVQSLTATDGAPIVSAKSRTELATVLGCHRNTLVKWERLADSPKPAPNGSRDVMLWRDWLHRTGRKAGTVTAPDDDKTKLEQRKLELQNAILEIELEAKRGELVARAEVERDASETAFRLKTSLLAIPDSVAPLLAGRDTVSIATELRRVIADGLRHLSEGKFQLQS